jgi:hypothetical protein
MLATLLMVAGRLIHATPTGLGQLKGHFGSLQPILDDWAFLDLFVSMNLDELDDYRRSDTNTTEEMEGAKLMAGDLRYLVTGLRSLAGATKDEEVRSRCEEMAVMIVNCPQYKVFVREALRA